MKKRLLATMLISMAYTSFAQITITASDMPVAGDTLRYSYSANAAGINLSQTGAATTWNFKTLSSTLQYVDTYKTAIQVNPIYALTISPSAYGYKVADSFPGLSSFIPISVKSFYTFYNKKSSPSRYVAEGFAAVISSIPTAAVYQDEDELYFFPLAFGTTNDSSNFRLTFSLPSIGSVLQKGYRKTTVDGWGTIETPYTSAPVNCIRVRTEVNEIDSVTIGVLPIGIRRHTVEYQWLANGEHYPLLSVTAGIIGGVETANGLSYRDNARSGVGIATTTSNKQVLEVYPNPATDKITIKLPADWTKYSIAVYDAQGRVVARQDDNANININALAAGNYMIQIQHSNQVAYAAFSK